MSKESRYLILLALVGVLSGCSIASTSDVEFDTDAASEALRAGEVVAFEDVNANEIFDAGDRDLTPLLVDESFYRIEAVGNVIITDGTIFKKNHGWIFIQADGDITVNRKLYAGEGTFGSTPAYSAFAGIRLYSTHGSVHVNAALKAPFGIHLVTGSTSGLDFGGDVTLADHTKISVPSDGDFEMVANRDVMIGNHVTISCPLSMYCHARIDAAHKLVVGNSVAIRMPAGTSLQAGFSATPAETDSGITIGDKFSALDAGKLPDFASFGFDARAVGSIEVGTNAQIQSDLNINIDARMVQPDDSLRLNVGAKLYIVDRTSHGSVTVVRDRCMFPGSLCVDSPAGSTTLNRADIASANGVTIGGGVTEVANSKIKLFVLPVAQRIDIHGGFEAELASIDVRGTTFAGVGPEDSLSITGNPILQ